MFELIQVSEHDYYVQSPAKIGLVRLNDTDVCLIDSGNDKDAGRKVRQILDANGWKLKAIYHTHSNADHTGGSKYLQSQTGCRVYAPGIECDFTRHTLLEPAFLYGGYPSNELRHKFLMAQPSDAQPLTEAVLPEGFEIIPLPGHFFDMVGFRTPDNTVFLGDCLVSGNTLEKYRISFVFDVASYLQTLEYVKTMEGKLFVPSHAVPTDDIAPLAQQNIDTVHAIVDDILALCTDPIGFEALLQKLFNTYALKMDFQQYALVGSTLRSYLAWLHDAGRLDVRFENNALLWARV